MECVNRVHSGRTDVKILPFIHPAPTIYFCLSSCLPVSEVGVTCSDRASYCTWWPTSLPSPPHTPINSRITRVWVYVALKTSRPLDFLHFHLSACLPGCIFTSLLRDRWGKRRKRKKWAKQAWWKRFTITMEAKIHGLWLINGFHCPVGFCKGCLHLPILKRKSVIATNCNFQASYYIPMLHQN